MNRKNVLETVFFSVIIAFCLFLLWKARELKFVLVGMIGPGVYPTVFLVVVLFLSVLLLVRALRARYVVIYSPFLQGLNQDLLLRQFGRMLAARLKQDVRVIAKNGTGRFSAYWAGRQGPSDGSVLVVATSELNELPNLFAAAYILKHFEPLARLFFIPDVLVTRPESAPATLAEFLERGRDAGAPLRLAVQHHPAVDYSIESFLEAEAGLRVERSANEEYLELRKALAAGQLDAVICSASEAAADIRDGTLAPLAVFSDSRFADLPDVPTFQIGERAFVSGRWAGMVAPRGIRQDDQRRLAGELEAILSDPDAVAVLETQGVPLARQDAKGFAAFLEVGKRQLVALQGKDEVGEPEKGRLFGLAAMIVFSFLFVFVMDWLGFMLTSIVFLMVGMALLWPRLTRRSTGAIGVIAVLFSMTLYFVFWQIFYVMFPAGRLFGG